MVLWKLNNSQLVGIIGIGGMFVGITGLIVNDKMQNDFKKTPQVFIQNCYLNFMLNITDQIL